MLLYFFYVFVRFLLKSLTFSTQILDLIAAVRLFIPTTQMHKMLYAHFVCDTGKA